MKFVAMLLGLSIFGCASVPSDEPREAPTGTVTFSGFVTNVQKDSFTVRWTRVSCELGESMADASLWPKAVLYFCIDTSLLVAGDEARTQDLIQEYPRVRLAGDLFWPENRDILDRFLEALDDSFGVQISFPQHPEKIYRTDLNSIN